MLNRKEIQVGTLIAAGHGMDLRVTEIRKNYAVGLWESRFKKTGKKVELTLDFSRLTNPHYASNYKIMEQVAHHVSDL